MTLTQLNYIVALADHLSFVRAAQATHVSQPTLSMQIQKLEDELGVQIFDRSQQPIEITPAGRQIIAQARVTLREALRIQELAADEVSEIAQTIRLGIIPTLSPSLAPPVVAKMRELYPNVSLELQELQSAPLIESLLAGEIDLGLIVTPLLVEQVEEVPTFYEPFVAYLGEGHPLMKSSKIDAKDINSDELWLLTEGHCFRNQALELCKGRSSVRPSGGRSLDAKTKRPLPRLESGSLETLWRMVDFNGGMTLLPLLSANGLPKAQRDRNIREFNKPVPIREVSVVHAKTYRRSATVNAVAHCVQSAVPKELLSLESNQGNEPGKASQRVKRISPNVNYHSSPRGKRLF